MQVIFRRPPERIIKGIKPLDPDRPAVRRSSAQLKRIIAEMLAEVAKPIARHIAAEAAKLGKSADPIADILAGLDFSAFTARIDPIADILAGSATEGAASALAQIGSSSAAASAISTRYAVDAARARAAEMVGMKLLPDGSIITNPNPVWAITEATRELLRPLVSAAVESGASAAQLADAVEQSSAFGRYRAEMVARTEIVMTNNHAAMAAYSAAGVRAKRWSTAGTATDKGYPVSDECQACEDQGEIPMGQAFVTGRMAPPNHPHCRCVVIPVIDA